MLDQARRKLAKSGAQQQARELLSQLQDMLEEIFAFLTRRDASARRQRGQAVR
jgi:hypothetical protein